MSRKKSKKEKPKAEAVKKPEELQGEPGRVDYGGLPSRDLKKNLGCG